VGAGIAGLSAARELHRCGIQVTLLDKARGVGGRMATRRFGGAVFDHGTQYFAPGSAWFQSRIAEWIDEGVACEWFRVQRYEMDDRFLSSARYRGHPTMTSIPKILASGLPVHTGDRVMSLTADTAGWTAITAKGSHISARSCILTPPVPQTLELLDASALGHAIPQRETLEDLVYEPCLALMVLCDRRPLMPEHGVLEFARGNLRRIMDNQRKGVSPDVPAVTIHATGSFSAIHFEDDEKTVADLLLDEALPMLRCGASSWQLHRWRYSQVITTHPEPFFQITDDPPLVVAGDAFGLNGVEGAARSGIEAARRILHLL
jgi:predicted NAD/FAD-dependent oxidoreductase